MSRGDGRGRNQVTPDSGAPDPPTAPERQDYRHPLTCIRPLTAMGAAVALAEAPDVTPADPWVRGLLLVATREEPDGAT